MQGGIGEMRSIPNEFEGKMALVRKIMDRELTPLQRETVEKYYLQGMNLCQIAKERGVYPSSVHRNLTGGMRTIRRFLLIDEDECKETVKKRRKQKGTACNYPEK